MKDKVTTRPARSTELTYLQARLARTNLDPVDLSQSIVYVVEVQDEGGDYLAGFVAASATLIPTESGPQRLPASVSTDAVPGAYAPTLSRPAPSVDSSEDEPDDE